MREIAERFEYKEGYLYKKNNGNKCTSTDANGYVRVCWDRGSLGRIRVFAHRLIYFMHYGDIPEGMYVDHIDMDCSNNFISNLRLVTKSGNAQNQRTKGYWLDKRSGKYRAQIKLNGKSKCLGLHTTAQEARSAYLRAKKELHPIASPDAFILN